MFREAIWFTLLVSPLFVFAQQLDRPGEWIDLTHPFNSDSIYWPTSPEFRKSTIAEGHTDGGWYYTAYEFSTAEHGGTHLDAPVHFAEGRHTTDQIPITRLTGPAVVIRVGDRAAGNRDYLISVADIRAWEKKHGRIADGAIVLFDTGSAPLYGDKVAYMGTDRRGKAAVDALHFPGLHPDAARFLADERDIDAVGLDTPSIDYGQSKDFMAHRILFEKNIPAFENLANLDKLPDKGAYVIALPMKIEGGSGGPLRIVAFLNHQTTDKK